MRLIRPIKVKPSDINSTTAVEDVTTVWDADTTYALHEKVQGDSERFGPSIYVSAKGANKGNRPEISPDDWVREGPTQRWAPFDQSASTQSKSTNTFSVTFTLYGLVEALAFFEAIGNKLIVEVESLTSGPVFREEVDLQDSSTILDWYQYFFAPNDYIRDGVVKNIPPYTTGVKVTVTVEGSGEVGLGEIVVGDLVEIGCTRYGASHGVRYYSRTETDSFGNTYMQEGGWAKKGELSAYVDKARHRYISRVLSELGGRPTVFIGSDDPDYEPLVIYGFLRDWRPVIDYPTVSLFNFEIQGLV